MLKELLRDTSFTVPCHTYVSVQICPAGSRYLSQGAFRWGGN